MALSPKRSTAAVNKEADQVVALLNSGKLIIYSGTQPANANTTAGAGVKLATLTFNATAAPAASGGVATFNAIASDTNAVAGTAAWFRCNKTANVDVTDTIFDGSVGTPSGYDLNLNSVAISNGATVAVTSFTYTANPG